MLKFDEFEHREISNLRGTVLLCPVADWKAVRVLQGIVIQLLDEQITKFGAQLRS